MIVFGGTPGAVGHRGQEKAQRVLILASIEHVAQPLKLNNKSVETHARVVNVAIAHYISATGAA